MHAALQTWTDCNGYNNIDDIPCWSTYVESTTTWQSFRGRFYMSDDPTVAFVRPFVCPSVAYIANNSRTQRPSLPRFGRKVPHLRCYSRTNFKVKRSKVRVTRPINADTHRAPYLPNANACEHTAYRWHPQANTNIVYVRRSYSGSAVLSIMILIGAQALCYRKSVLD